MNRSTIAIIAAVVVMVALSAQWEERDAQGYFERAENFAFRGRFTDAIADYTRAIELAPDFSEAYRKRAVAHMNLTEYDLAIADQDEAIRHNPTRARAYYDRGIAHYFLKHQKAACRDMHIACALGLDNGCIQARLGCTAAEKPERHLILRAEPVKTVQRASKGAEKIP